MSIVVNGSSVTSVHVRYDGRSYGIVAEDLDVGMNVSSNELFRAVEAHLGFNDGVLNGFELDIASETENAVIRPAAKFGQGEENMAEQEVKVSPEQEYINSIVIKFKENPNDETLSSLEKTLLAKIMESEKAITTSIEQVNTLSDEIKERQGQVDRLYQEVTHQRGKVQGIVDSLLAARNQ